MRAHHMVPHERVVLIAGSFDAYGAAWTALYEIFREGGATWEQYARLEWWLASVGCRLV